MLTELEGAVLGVVARKQPLTAYAIRKEFESAVTQSWSASAGAIYPLVRKLVKEGSLAETVKTSDRRGTVLLNLTDVGVENLIGWLKISDIKTLGPVADPMRTRGFAFSQLSPLDRRTLLNSWAGLTREAIELTKMQISRFSDEGDITAEMATRGTELQLEARLKWINELIERESSV